MEQGNQPRGTRASGSSEFRRALVAVAISALVAVGVAAPMALSIDDEPPETTTTSTSTTAPSTPSSDPDSSSITSETTVPVNVLGTNTVKEDNPGALGG